MLDILDVERPNTPEVSKESIMGTDARKVRAPNIVDLASTRALAVFMTRRAPIPSQNKLLQKRKLIEATFKRPEGMHRELYALLFSDAR